MMNLTILGATGSIGVSTLDVVARYPDRYKVVALSGHTRVELLAEQCHKFNPAYAVVGSATDAQRLTHLLSTRRVNTQVLYGTEALAHIASLPEVDAVMAAIVGAAGLMPTLAAVSAGKRVLLANKEALVMAGDLFMAEVRKSGACLLPIDSEHNAIFQSMPAGYAGNLSRAGVSRILLTASGGPFRDTAIEALSSVTPEQAVAHPKWTMGRKISVDSSTMMNKGLEVIEAHWLFNASANHIEVVIHPQSVIHSLVEYVDGSVLAQLGNPDMRTPIAHALAWPQRIDSGVERLDLFAIGQLTFERPDLARFPCLGLAYQALRAGGNAPAVLNAANEVAVSAFLAGDLPFLKIAAVIAETLAAVPCSEVATIDAVMTADDQGRIAATRALAAYAQ
ncbi:1-deoxy-D-xylulose 5-phosphate reductoisomerase [Rugosibacter aromaticivorans]|uniref:1-deoxy-D-xylulose 5-phosphate reductoisomerase n=1 Tax=Rugosibacter aromaticivorans TaxID=1565605 RepID=A0A0C5J983_9PROT|nr:1-deoxy-D-xylulose-5-phosphate reductoisomerase [Rugosibacter aromaticivorans]AJP48219.1 1-deoxy-D-xylulose 5-phosphate reductoisomerase [Rugosibacter aromaticivorans]TBR14906.1 MAG: 1-deoxy-D-xylulose-5-phosphate reductoisomerase [Rugosibacter sp.]